jgi:hypothetical protein
MQKNKKEQTLHIFTAKNTPITVPDKLKMHNFDVQLPFIISHVINGEIKRGHSFGIHYFQKELHKINELITPANELGIWEATIYMLHPKTKNWVSKKKSSTFFPENWDYNTLLLKIKEAFDNKRQTHSYKFLGNTSCGIPVVFLYRDNIVVACYPILN